MRAFRVGRVAQVAFWLIAALLPSLTPVGADEPKPRFYPKGLEVLPDINFFSWNAQVSVNAEYVGDDLPIAKVLTRYNVWSLHLAPSPEASVTGDCLLSLQETDQSWNLTILGVALTAEHIQHLSSLNTIQSLSIHSDQISGEAWKALSSFKSLQQLSIRSDSLTDDHLAEFVSNSPVKSLQVEGKSLTGAFLTRFKCKPAFHMLGLRSPVVTDERLTVLSEFSRLDYVSLAGCEQITDASLDSIRKLKRLKNLSLSGTKVTDAGVALLQPCQKLEELSVNRCEGVTSKTLTLFSQIDSLNRIIAIDTKITPEEALPYDDFFPGLRVVLDESQLIFGSD